MAKYYLKNKQLEICVDSFGAELKSVKDRKENREYMWDAKPEYWKRTSPVLFPFVGGLKDNCYRYNKKEYPMSQHGFARDMEFEVIKQTEKELTFVLNATQETLEKYPFCFQLEISYVLAGEKLTVSWRVCNQDDKEMYFSIGGHPAFMCPINEGEVQTDCKILFDVKDSIVSSVIGEGGTLSSRKKTFSLNDGYLDITADLFDEDALIIEGNQAHSVALCNHEGKPYLTVNFDAPLFGIWSPVKKNAPFICIEPWYGRCDKEDFKGELSEREWGNKLAPTEEFYTSYTISVANAAM